MRVTYVANRLNTAAGGVDLSLSLMARSIAERGHEVRVVTANTDDENVVPGDAPYEVIERPVEYVSRVQLARSLYAILEEFEPETDLYHVFEPAFISVAGLYRRRGGTAAVVGRLNAYTLFCSNLARMDGECYEHCSIRDKFAHDSRSFGAKLLRTPQYVSRTHLEPRLLNGVDRLFAISPTVGTAYEHNGVDGDLIDLVPNFYNPAFSLANADGEGPAETDRTRLLYVGRLTEIKGVDLLVEAVGRLDRDDAYLDIVGDGDRRDALEDRVAAAGIGDRVTFHGWIDHRNLPLYYDAADVFVHPGRLPEPFGRTMLEALQFDCPLVVSDVGAPPWVVGEAGVTFRRDDPADLAAVLSDLLEDPEMRERLRRHCEDRRARFAPERVLDRIEDRYADVLEGAPQWSEAPDSERET